MQVRVVTFTGAKDIAAGIEHVKEKVIPLLEQQRGFRGITASADRAGGVLGVLTLWETAEDREASDGPLSATREEATEVIGGTLSVETFEQLVAEIGQRPPDRGSALMVTRIRMDPAKIDDNITYFKSEVVPHIKASAGFQGMRNMINRATGEGIVGTAWSGDAAMRRAADEARRRREPAIARGVNFGDVSFREILLSQMR